MRPIDTHVECYSGSRADERPLRYSQGDCMVEVMEILRRWREPDADVFDIRDGESRRRLLRHHLVTDRWTLRDV